MNKRTILACAIVALWALAAFSGALLDLDTSNIALEKILHSPDSLQWFGYDDLGRSIADRVWAGAGVSFLVSITVVALSLLLGMLIGGISGFAGGWVDQVMVKIIDVFLAFPGILLAIAMSAVMGPGIENVVIALSVVGWVGFARLTRAQVLSIKEREHVKAARAIGVPSTQIFLRHVLPLTVTPIIVEASFAIAGIVIAEAGLSFLGLGVQPPQASWGSMIRDGSQYMLVAPHMVLAPGIALSLVVLSVNLLGDYLRDRLDVKEQ